VSKTDRFRTPPKAFSTEFTFDPSSHSTFNHTFYTAKRAPTFGYGNKLDLSKGGNVAKTAPGQYQLASKFEYNRKHGYGFNFGTNREKFRNVLTNNMCSDKVSPGPGA